MANHRNIVCSLFVFSILVHPSTNIKINILGAVRVTLRVCFFPSPSPLNRNKKASWCLLSLSI
uniref:Uncharacterized protein n=1 Tax=Anguilla anguilla TaxID=7936 RepID=A0A0E9WSR5_ANGAN